MSLDVARIDWSDPAAGAWWREGVRAARLRSNSLFQTWEWNRHWWDHFGEGAHRELFLLKIMEGGAIRCIAPFVIQSPRLGAGAAWRKIMWLGTDDAERSELITEEEDCTILWDRILRHCFEQVERSWLELWDILPDASLNDCPAFPPDCAVRSTAGRAYQRIPLPAEGEVESILEKGLRNNLLRAEKRLCERGVAAWELVRNPGRELIEHLIRLNKERFGERSVFRREKARAFFRDVTGDSALNSRISLALLSIDGEPISILAGCGNIRSWDYLLSGSSQAFARFSPAGINLLHLLRRGAEERWEAVDFLRGDESYKRRWGAVTTRSRMVDLYPRGMKIRHAASRIWGGLRHGLKR